MAEEVTIWKSPHHIVVYQFEYFFLLGVLLQTGVLDVGVHHHEVLFPLPAQSRHLVFAIGRHVLEQQFPDFASVDLVGKNVL